MPANLRDRLGSVIGGLAMRYHRRRYNIVKVNLSLCFPELDDDAREAMIQRHFRAQFQAMLNYGALWWGTPSKLRNQIVLQGQEQIGHYRSKGKNVIIMACHSVALDFGVTGVTMDYSASGPFKPVKSPIINWLVARGRTRFGGRVYTRDVGLRPIVKDLKAGRLLFYLPDEDLGAEQSVFVPFFGQEKATIPVLGRLAKLGDAVVLPCISCYDAQKNRYIVHLLPAIENFPQGDDVIDATMMNQALEAAIRVCPDQYLWSLRYFKTRPGNQVSPYKQLR